MKAIIFSRNRAMQLDCLLRSIYQHCPFMDISVLYRADTSDYKQAYNILQEEHADVSFVEEKHFCYDFYNMIDTWYMCLLVDDCVFYRDVDQITLFEMTRDVDIISLRIGDSIAKHRNYHGSIDGNIYSNEIITALRSKYFINPNWLEAHLVRLCRSRTMAWMKNPHLKGIPANKVSDYSTCADMGINTERLNDLYLMGKRINRNLINFITNDVHENIDLLKCIE